jgi:hypothetical protein
MFAKSDHWLYPELIQIINNNNINNSVALVHERTIPAERPPLVGKVVPTFVDIGCHVVSAVDP